MSAFIDTFSGVAQAAAMGTASACFCTGKCRELGYCPSQGLSFDYFTRILPSPHDGKGYTLHTPRGREMTAGDLGLHVLGIPEQLAEAKRHIEALTSFYMDNVLWTQAAEKARAFALGIPSA